MSTPELPAPAGRIEKPGNLGEIRSRLVLVDAFTADQMREMYRAGRLAGLEEADELAALSQQMAEWHLADHDECGRIAKRVMELATAIRSLKEKQG